MDGYSMPIDGVLGVISVVEMIIDMKIMRSIKNLNVN